MNCCGECVGSEGYLRARKGRSMRRNTDAKYFPKFYVWKCFLGG